MQRAMTLRMLRRHAIIAFLEGLIIFSILILMIINRNPDTSHNSIPYSKAPGHIIVQLAEHPEPTGTDPGMRTEQEWVLYGDGTLLFQKDPGDDLWQAHLSPAAVRSLLDVIINQNQFFATRQRYSTSQVSDENELLLRVDANSQQREVAVTRKPPANDAPDNQRRLFLIEQFLFAYHPVDALFYIPNSDLDGENGK